MTGGTVLQAAALYVILFSAWLVALVGHELHKGRTA